MIIVVAIHFQFKFAIFLIVEEDQATRDALKQKVCFFCMKIL